MCYKHQNLHSPNKCCLFAPLLSSSSTCRRCLCVTTSVQNALLLGTPNVLGNKTKLKTLPPRILFFNSSWTTWKTADLPCFSSVEVSTVCLFADPCHDIVAVLWLKGFLGQSMIWIWISNIAICTNSSVFPFRKHLSLLNFKLLILEDLAEYKDP